MKAFFKKIICLFVSLILFWTTVTYPKQDLSSIPKIYIPKLIDYSLSFFVAQSLAGDFMDYVNEGKNLGSANIESYKTENLSSTLQQKGLGDAKQITPQSELAEQQKGSYSQYYTDPEGMVTAPYDPETKSFVEQSYTQDNPVVQSYINDLTFGNRCLQKDSDGKCIKWSLSDEILYKNFPDCDEIVEPIYDEPPDYRTCVVTVTSPIISDLCQVTSYIRSETEWVSTPCNLTDPGFVSGQIYAVCKDYYEWYRIPGGSNDPHNTPINFIALSSISELPPDAVFGFAGSNIDDYSWAWYYRYKGSIIERLILSRDNSCGLNFEEMIENCTVDYLEVCEANWQNCVKIVENGQETGLMPELEYIVKKYMGHQSYPCEEVCQFRFSLWPGGGGFICPGNGCYMGICLSNAPLRDDVSGLTLVGKERVNAGNDCYFDPEANNDTGGIIGEAWWDEYNYYTDRRVCRDVAGSIENYVICLNGETIRINNGTGFVYITNPATRIDGSCVEVGVVTITYFYLYGSPEVSSEKGYIWNGKIKFSCGGGEETGCQELIEQGCVYYSHRCLDADCTQIEYTYNCGGTGQVVGYNVQYVCSDGIRCMGSECHDTSYEANDDFIKVATAFTILNMYRADSDGVYIFPGEDSRCQSKPKNCCKNPGIGISIGDYVRAGLAAIKVYSLLSGGASATWVSFANAFSAVLQGNIIQGFIQYQFGVGVAQLYCQTLTPEAISLAQQMGIQVIQTSEGIYVVGANAQMISTLATVFTVVSIALTVYTILKFIYDFVFQCTREDIITSYKVGLRLCHYVGEYCASKVLGMCLKKKKTYCCFNSILARLVHECVRPQIGRGWGGARDPDCGGLLPGELASADLSICDFTEYMQYVQFKTQLTEQDIENIQNKVKNKVNSP